jgi:aspartate aminotransferase
VSSVILNPDVINLKESSTLKINQLAKKMRAEGKTVYHFGFGQSPFPVHEKIVKALQEHAHEKDYLPTLGLPQLRETISTYYKEEFGYDFKPEHILLGPGSKELLFQALYVLEGPVIIPAPSWVSYGPQVNIRGKHIMRVVTQYENNYKLQPDELENICNALPDEQKVLILNSPNNPSGAVYSEKEVQALSEVCRRRNVIVVSDEIYAMVDFKLSRRKGFAHFYPEGTIVTAGLSKSHSAGGYRLGFLAAGKELEPLITCLASLVSETFSAVSAPIQYAAVTAYSRDKDLLDYVNQCTKIHKAAGEYMAKRFNHMGVACPEPEGAFYIMPSFDGYKDKLVTKFGDMDSQKLANLFLEHAHVAMLPGSDFYMPHYMLCCRVATVDYDGEAVYKASLKATNIDDEFIETFCPNIKAGLDSLEKFLNEL